VKGNLAGLTRIQGALLLNLRQKRLKDNSCHGLAGWYVGRPFKKGWAQSRTAGRKGTNGLKCPAPMSAGGHNNTKINPVFRGMVRL
jgi:hypothetical protein